MWVTVNTLNLRMFVRKILGRKGAFLLRNVLSEISYRLGLINALKEGKENGITAMVCTYNEMEWVEPSLLSIRDLVDEYIVVDSSSDDTPRIIERLRDEYGLPIRIYRIPPGDLVKARNIVLRESKYKWILHWDADFIAWPKLIDIARELVESSDPRRYYLYYWVMLRLCGDLHHLCNPPNFPYRPYHIEHWLFTWSSKLKYKWVGAYDSLIAPLYMYKAKFINRVLGVHLAGVRLPSRLFVKHVWKFYRKESDEYVRRGGTFEEFAKIIAKNKYNVDDINEAGKILLRKLIETLPPYDEKKFGRLPQILIDYASRKNPWALNLG